MPWTNRNLRRFVFCLSLALAASASAQFDSNYLESPPGDPNLSQAVQVIIDRTNELRKEEGPHPVKLNDRLTVLRP